MRRPTGDQEVAGSTPAEVGNILSWRLIMEVADFRSGSVIDLLIFPSVCSSVVVISHF